LPTNHGGPRRFPTLLGDRRLWLAFTTIAARKTYRIERASVVAHRCCCWKCIGRLRQATIFVQNWFAPKKTVAGTKSEREKNDASPSLLITQPRQIPSTRNRDGMNAWSWVGPAPTVVMPSDTAAIPRRSLLARPALTIRILNLPEPSRCPRSLRQLWRLQGETGAHPIIKDRYQQQSSVRRNCS
jgi:hypothetical protein